MYKIMIVEDDASLSKALQKNDLKLGQTSMMIPA